MLTGERTVSKTGLDVAALKPAECDVRRALELPFDTVAIDYEGRERLPSTELLSELAAEKRVFVTTPVRADGFDPLGDDSLYDTLPAEVDPVFVAGHPAYLTDAERSRAIAPRLGAARERNADAWVGTEGIERVALAAGGPQYELLSRTTDRDVRALRAAGFEETIVLYAPTVCSDDEDEILDAVGGYVSRRGPVRRALPEDAPTDSSATGRAREVLSKASRDYTLVGTPEEVGQRVRELKALGVDVVAGYPARGVDEFLD
ncbi:hypothetical protein SAMN04487948_102352 [Halogranum amylolyticum]|uniref:Luciferase-like monooxygenase n=1 Tax=Halogranum amylolyticum TaxID=660520 RepID=A0A1H8PJW8_9EURY|nr:luciferase [Halogranum amylolyticum]SEO42240.1 hypothetical protein SAMN04487948_102352 [Halogranum amylolyticum]